ncbi:MAG: flavodoxin-dependent (E)-4-hydroxy-3-methylbut-2-enyl-diphosphate synthase [Clostridiales Family XIII bacterium]|jgi:(E)-4-hydroxy-3-methylbut-2-enyl-diphosphate synthase|nr:flavodoxin-dependent (E)-4-hydroxy-3-methylbut-2-enyl-diphosphate synthase [Clostridiales Family XIII bacterium]
MNMPGITRRKSRQVDVGGVLIGGGARIPIQSMTNTFTEDVAATVAQIRALVLAGCDIVRCTVPTEEAAAALGEIKRTLRAGGLTIPLVADIHFDYRLALAAIASGADKIRINPGNIGSADRVKAVADAAGAAGIPIRIGINGGSLERDLLARFGGPTAAALAESALRNASLLENMGFSDLVVSIKSSDARENLEAHRLFAANSDLPLHIGLTEAGIGRAAIVKSAVGIGALLLDGIGDTIRVSLTGDPVQEIAAARDILRAAGLLPGAIDLISCPTCGRTKADLERLAAEVAEALAVLEATHGLDRKHITVAVMGCAVNGPGEAAHADLGVACGENNAVYFEHGVKIKTIDQSEIVSTLIDGVKKHFQ